MQLNSLCGISLLTGNSCFLINCSEFQDFIVAEETKYIRGDPQGEILKHDDLSLSWILDVPLILLNCRDMMGKDALVRPKHAFVALSEIHST